MSAQKSSNEPCTFYVWADRAILGSTTEISTARLKSLAYFLSSFFMFVISCYCFFSSKKLLRFIKISGKSILVLLELAKRFGEYVYYNINIYGSMRQA